MRKAAAVFFILVTGLSRSVFPEGSAVPEGRRGAFVLSDARETVGFSLAPQAGEAYVNVDMSRPTFRGQEPDPAVDIVLARVRDRLGLDGPAGGITAAVRIPGEIAAPLVKKGAPAPVSLSVYMGRGKGDVFTSLHEHYAWRTIFKAMNLGAGVFRDIRIARAIHIRPYLGVIRSYARLRPSYLYGDASFEYRLTALCVGLPLVCVFN